MKVDRMSMHGKEGGIVARLTAAMILTLFLVLPALAITNPHDLNDPDRCRSCHTSEIHDVKADDYNYYLLKEKVDDVCLICHKKKDCCVIGQDHLDKLFIGEHSHPSDLPTLDVPKIHFPKTLPLQDDRITCNTCHDHERREENDYKLVRMVIVKETGVDWTPLCADCHEDY
jgi:hypothetical protein